MKSLLNALQEGRLVELPPGDKQEALVYLAHLIEAIPDHEPGVDLVEAMMARERQANTGLGSGVACPHVRAPGGGEMLCAVGWNPSGVDYGAPDGKKVHLLLMYYIPDAHKNAYLKEVSMLAASVKREGGISAIAEAKDIGEVRERLLDWVSAAVEAGLPEAKARMIRLEARQAAVEAAPSAPAGAPQALVQVVSLKVVLMDGRPIVLCKDAGLSSALEGWPAAAQTLRQEAQFELAGYKLVCQGSTQYGADRAFYELLAIRAS